MGRRSRRRGEPETFTDRVVARADERPKPPWHPVPLVELCVLAGIVLIVLGFLDFDDRDGRTMLLMGLVLASLGGLDTVARDHFAGFRSHTLVLSMLPAVLTSGLLFFLRAPWPAVVAGAAVVFATAFWFFRDQFRKRAGVTFRA